MGAFDNLMLGSAQVSRRIKNVKGSSLRRERQTRAQKLVLQTIKN